MFDKPVVFVDIETAGTGWRRSRIIELAAIRFENGREVGRLHSLVNPGAPLPEYISSITGITDKDLIGQPYFDELARQFLDISREAIFVAHNVRFDYSFLKNQLEELGYSFRPQLLCTVRLSRALYPEHRRHNLESVINDHGLNVSNRHRAADDAAVLLEFCRLAHQQHGAKFQAVVQSQLKARSLPPNLPPGLTDGLPSACGVYIFEDSGGQPLYVGKSINIKKRVQSHFTSDIKIYKEMRLSMGVHHIRTITTDNELEALLLESRLVKELLPLHNQQLRRARSHTAIVKGTNGLGYTTLSIEPVDLSECRDFSLIYGLFTTKGKAKTALLEHQKTFGLCPKLLGFERGRGRCFQAQIGRCAGACDGREKPEKYNLRVDIALERTRLQAWPFNDPVVVRHKASPHKGLVVDQWRIIGEADESGVTLFSAGPNNQAFDLDIYKILSGYLRRKKDQLLISGLRQFSYA